MTRNVSSNVILGAVAEVLGDMRAELRKEIAAGPAAVNNKLYLAVLYRKGVDARDAISGFCDAYLHQRAHVTKGQPPAILKAAIEPPQRASVEG
jgi:hypothetical protein